MEYVQLTPEQMEKRSKIALMKQTIKVMVAQQKMNKNNRKSDSGLDQILAQSRHAVMRFNLKHYYVAYALARGKHIEHVLTLSKEDCKLDHPYESKYNKDIVSNILNQYGIKIQAQYNS